MIHPPNQYFDLSHFALLEISGNDANEFLQNQIAGDVSKLHSSGWLFSAWCQPDGRVICTFILFAEGTSLMLILPSMLKDKIINRLSKFILRSKVTIKDVSDEYALIGLAGPDMYMILQTMHAGISGNANPKYQTEDLCILRMWGKTPRSILISRMDKVSTILDRVLIAFTEGDRATWSLMDIEAGIPWILEATSGAFLPQMLNIDQMQGLSYQKGCYPGQEVIARLHHRGQLKRRMYLGTCNNEVMPGPGDRLERTDTGTLAGDVIDAERHPDGGFSLLAVTEISAADGAPLRLHGTVQGHIKLQSITYPAEHFL
ncbi:MAG: hypothetical protein HW411_1027 [Gammaproteobacteria bacterium]|nr:hypothetical protein [Gammaproteobacteria bacterium]